MHLKSQETLTQTGSTFYSRAALTQERLSNQHTYTHIMGYVDFKLNEQVYEVCVKQLHVPASQDSDYPEVIYDQTKFRVGL